MRGPLLPPHPGPLREPPLSEGRGEREPHPPGLPKGGNGPPCGAADSVGARHAAPVPDPERQSEAVVHIPLHHIEPNPLQPRRQFDPERIRLLSQSIAQQGVIQPLVLRRHPRAEDRYQLVAGERRLRALQLLGWAAAPAIVRVIRDTELLETALVENLQREPLTPIEEAQALRDLLERHGFTQESLAGRIGRDRSTISNLVRLLELPLPIQEDLETGRLSAGHARALLSVTDTVLQIGLRNEVLRRGLTVRETERLIRIQSVEEPAPAEAGSTTDAPLSPEYQAARQALERKLGTKVGIHESEGQGRLELEFYSLDDFNRLYDWLMGKGR